MTVSAQVDALTAELAALAEARQTIAYGALAARLGWRMGALTAALEALMAQDLAQGRPLRAALCHARLGNGLPAEGFFSTCAALGLSIPDRASFVQETRETLWGLAQN